VAMVVDFFDVVVACVDRPPEGSVPPPDTPTRRHVDSVLVASPLVVQGNPPRHVGYGTPASAPPGGRAVARHSVNESEPLLDAPMTRRQKYHELLREHVDHFQKPAFAIGEVVGCVGVQQLFFPRR
jgi:hypothetical protein